jgi:hypothetical protein
MGFVFGCIGFTGFLLLVNMVIRYASKRHLRKQIQRSEELLDAYALLRQTYPMEVRAELDLRAHNLNNVVDDMRDLYGRLYQREG